MKNIITTIILYFIVYTVNAQIANWKLTGPIKFPTNKSGQVNGMGHVTQIAFHPSDPNKMYATNSGGGLFISTDLGKNWQVTGTDKLLNMYCSSVCADHTNVKTIYLGSSYGIWKSIDDGITFTLSNNGIGNRKAVDIIMDPVDNKVLVAATGDGIWKTTDAGVTWDCKKKQEVILI